MNLDECMNALRRDNVYPWIVDILHDLYYELIPYKYLDDMKDE
jgi:hypothetical protein